MDDDAMLAVTSVSKSFPGVKSLDRVSFEVRQGEIHGLVGENGAGKSTLIKVIAGVHQPDEGEMRLDGQRVHWSSPKEARRAGIHVIYQELVLFPHLTVAENIFLGYERRGPLGLVDWRRTNAEARELLRRLGVDLDPRALAGDLPVADQQMVEIAKAAVHEIKLLILDEPTAVIAGREVELLFERLRALRAEGVAVVYISHRLEEVFALCDRVTVLKDGELVGTRLTAEVDRDQLITMMVGREMSDLFPQKRAAGTGAGEEVLRIENFASGTRVRDASLTLRRGEILGLAGMVGAGRTELAMSIFGADPAERGRLVILGKERPRLSPAQAIELGIGLLTEDRKGEGLLMQLDVAANISAPRLAEVMRGPWLDRSREMAIARAEIARYQVACRGPQTPVTTMSGGNQQKVLISRWARIARNILILDEPTRGVDVGAKSEIYRIVRKLADDGVGILMISSELPEIVGMADRVVVMREGVTTGELSGAEISEPAILDLATQHRAAA